MTLKVMSRAFVHRTRYRTDIFHNCAFFSFFEGQTRLDLLTFHAGVQFSAESIYVFCMRVLTTFTFSICNDHERSTEISTYGSRHYAHLHCVSKCLVFLRLFLSLTVLLTHTHSLVFLALHSTCKHRVERKLGHCILLDCRLCAWKHLSIIYMESGKKNSEKWINYSELERNSKDLSYKSSSKDFFSLHSLIFHFFAGWPLPESDGHTRNEFLKWNKQMMKTLCSQFDLYVSVVH